MAPLFIFAVVVGSIYAGWATPTEAASMGVFAALVLAAWERALSWPMLKAVFEGTMRTTAMIMLIIIAAQFLNFVLANIGVTDGVAKAISALGLGKVGTMLLLVVFYLILGCFMETISMMILTTPFVFPIVVGLGWDPIWWGIVLTILIEAALVTPPVGLNLYVVQSLRATRRHRRRHQGRVALRRRDARADRAADGLPRYRPRLAQLGDGPRLDRPLSEQPGGPGIGFLAIDCCEGLQIAFFYAP